MGTREGRKQSTSSLSKEKVPLFCNREGGQRFWIRHDTTLKRPTKEKTHIHTRIPLPLHVPFFTNIFFLKIFFFFTGSESCTAR